MSRVTLVDRFGARVAQKMCRIFLQDGRRGRGVRSKKGVCTPRSTYIKAKPWKPTQAQKKYQSGQSLLGMP